MDSLRMCVVCRSMKSKNELVRVVKVKGESPKIDLTFKVQGRGAYICKDKACIENAQKRRVFERAFQGAVDREIYECLGELADE